jgi:hypothetical protein
VQAGTAISNRRRGETNSFNVLHIRDANLIVERLTWNVKTSSYTLSKAEEFRRTAEGWAAAKSGG